MNMSEHRIEPAHAPCIRVVLGLEPAAVAVALARTAASIAVSLRAGIAGIGIVQTELERAAALPFGALVGPTGAIVDVDEQALARTVRSATARARREAAAAVEEFGLTLTFDVVEGPLLERLRSSQAPGDVFVIGPRSETLTARLNAPLAVLVDDVAPVALIQAAARLGREAEPRVIALVPPHLSAVETRLPSRAGQAHVMRRRVADLEPVSLARAVQTPPAGGLVVALNGSWLTEKSLRLLRGRLTCPLFLVG
jgi:hypothetical protein